MAAAWPASLPQYFEPNGFQFADKPATVASQTDIGPARIRRRATGQGADVQGSFILSAAQRDTLRGFYNTTLFNGTLPFTWVDPFDDQTAKDFQFVAPPTITAVGQVRFRASLTLEMLP